MIHGISNRYNCLINKLIIFTVIEISLGEYGDQADRLVKYIDNGKSTEWLKYTKQQYANLGWSLINILKFERFLQFDLLILSKI